MIKDFHRYSIQKVRVKTENERFHALFQFDLHSYDLKAFSVLRIVYFKPLQKIKLLEVKVLQTVHFIFLKLSLRN